MKTKNMFILSIFGLILVIFLFTNIKTTVMHMLGIETQDSKIERLSINNKEQKEALLELKKQTKMLKIKNSIELNTTVKSIKQTNKLNKKINTLITSLKPDVNKTKILNTMHKKYHIAIPSKPVVARKRIRHINTPKTVKDASETSSTVIYVNKTNYLVNGYRNIKSIYTAYDSIIKITSPNKKDKK